MSNTLLQPAIFLAMLYGGAVMGICYDICRLPRRLCRVRIVHTICDILFVVLAIFITAGSLLLATGGSLRLYLLVGLCAGFFLEQWSISYLFYQFLYMLRTR